MLLGTDENIRRLTRVVPKRTKEIAEQMGMSVENLAASLSGRRPMVSGERLNTLRKIVGVTDNLTIDSSKVHCWRPTQRNQEDLQALLLQMFPGPVERTEILFSDSEVSVSTALHSPDFLVLLLPYVGLDLSYLTSRPRPPRRVGVSIAGFCSMPSDSARKLIDEQEISWDDAVAYLKSINIGPRAVVQWGGTHVQARSGNGEAARVKPPA